MDYLNVIVMFIEILSWALIMFKVHSSHTNTIAQDDHHSYHSEPSRSQDTLAYFWSKSSFLVIIKSY